MVRHHSPNIESASIIRHIEKSTCCNNLSSSVIIGLQYIYISIKIESENLYHNVLSQSDLQNLQQSIGLILEFNVVHQQMRVLKKTVLLVTSTTLYI